MEFIFDEIDGELCLKSVGNEAAGTANSQRQTTEYIHSVETIEHGIKTIELQKKSFKIFDDVFQKCSTEIASMNLEHQKENSVYKILLQLCEVSKELCKSELQSVLCDQNKQMFDSAYNAINSSFEYILEKINAKSNRYKRCKQMKSNPMYVQPEEKAVGLKWVSKSVDSSDLIDWKLTDTTFQYISPIKTIESLFTRDDFSQMYFDYNRTKHTCSEGINIL